MKPYVGAVPLAKLSSLDLQNHNMWPVMVKIMVKGKLEQVTAKQQKKSTKPQSQSYQDFAAL